MKAVAPRRLAGALALITCLAGATACTLLLDKSAEQCQGNDDCWKFPGRPVCSSANHLCVSSGLQPDYCVQPPLKQTEDFYNQCTPNWLAGAVPGKCLSFDNCARVGLCPDAGAVDADAGSGVIPPPTVAPAASADGGGGTFPAVLPLCKDPAAGRGSVVFISGSSNFVTLLGRLAPIVTTLTNGLVPVFRQTDSCTGARSMNLDNPTRMKDHFIQDPVPGSGAAYAQYYDALGAHDCLLGPAGAEVDVGEAEIAAETCGLHAPDPASVRHVPGPILPILFVVPRNSVESAISAEAARKVLGSGKLGDVAPWTETSLLFIRAPGTATARLIGLAIGLPVPQNRFWGIDPGSAVALDKAMRGITDLAAQNALGLLGADTYDGDREQLKVLAFQATGQDCAFTPDSSLFTTDKRNVRDGHYPIWGRLHFFAAVGANGSYVSDRADKFVSLFSQTKLDLGLLDAFIASSWIPDCAMNVERDVEMGKFLTDHPSAFPCGCRYDYLTNDQKVPDGCAPCTTDSNCPPSKPSCNFGFCESR